MSGGCSSSAPARRSRALRVSDACGAETRQTRREMYLASVTIKSAGQAEERDGAQVSSVPKTPIGCF